MRWLSSTKERGEKILLVLDDIDGLGDGDLSEVSKIVAGSNVEIIFTSRDPQIIGTLARADVQTFELAALVEADALSLLFQITVPVEAAEASQSRDRTASDVTRLLGSFPASIISGAHYIEDSLGSLITPNLERFRNRWQSHANRIAVLRDSRPADPYYTILKSFQISIARLRRNTCVEDADLFHDSIILLILLSLHDFQRFERRDMIRICNHLKTWVTSNPGCDTCITFGRSSDLEQDDMRIQRCLTQLKRVSLITEVGKTASFVVNELVRHCVLTREQDRSALVDDKICESTWKDLKALTQHVYNGWLSDLSTNSRDDLNLLDQERAN